MKLNKLKTLAIDSYRKILFNSYSIKNGVSIGLSACFIFNCIISFLACKSLNKLHLLMKCDKSSNFCEYLEEYFQVTAILLIFKALNKIIQAIFIQKAKATIQAQLIKFTMEMPHYDFVKKSPGDLISQMNDLGRAYSGFFEISFFKIPSIIIFSALSIINSPRSLTFQNTAILTIYPILFLTFVSFDFKKLLNLNRLYYLEKRKNATDLLDKIQNFEIIKSFNTQNSEADDFYNKLEKEKSRQFILKKNLVDKKFFLSIFSEIPYMILVFIISRSNYENFAPLLIILNSLNKMLFELNFLANKLVLSLDSIDKQTVPLQCYGIDLNFNDKIIFRSVSVYHDDLEILKNINLEIKKGEKVVIVGQNGTGKSTLIKSLIKFSSFRNEITIDDININEISPSSLFKLISYVSQDDYIANSTVISNIKIGNKNIDENYIKKIAENLGLQPDFSDFKDGLETNVGTSGSQISVGQRQKISLLRALVKDTPILILDEATSSIDKKYEEAIVKNIIKLKDKTVLMIIHQKDLVQNFDKIIFLNSGTVECVGTYSELIHSNANFKQFIHG